MKNLLQVAINEFGIKEIKGPKHNKRIVQYAKDSNFTWINDDETAWCSTFMNWVALQAGLNNSKSAAARSWLQIGIEVSDPEPGDVIVLWRGSIKSNKGHVGIYLGHSKSGDRVYVLGGNQGDAVSITGYPTTRILSFRRLTAFSKVSLPKKFLKKGDRGQEVIKLQDILKVLGFNPGTSDGIFGDKTAFALKQLQSTKDGIEANGIYNFETKELIRILITDKG